MKYSDKINFAYLKDLMDRGKPSETHPSSNARSVKWVDGLRGLASFTVLTSHLARAFDYPLFLPSDTESVPARLFQLPFFRLWPQGRIGVAIFALLTGFVCGIKPLKQIRAGESTVALSTLSKAAFKRPMRLMLPGTVATLIAWVICQLGLFWTAGRVDSDWIRTSSPQPEGGLYEELWRLEKNLRSTWTNGHNDYDDHQWTLLPLLKCSLYTYAVLTAVAHCGFRVRLLAYFLVFSLFWQDNRPDTETFFCTAFFGLLLSDLSQHKSFQALATSSHPLRRVLSTMLIFAGLFIASYPVEHYEWKAWSRAIQPLEYFFPLDTALPKRFTALGLMMTTLGIALNNTARALLCSRPFQVLGKYSFAVYLTHGTVLKTVLIWMLYGVGRGWQAPKEGEDPVWLKAPGTAWFWICIGAWLGCVYGVAWAWTVYVDTWCERVSQWVMRSCLDGGSGAGGGEKIPPPATAINGTARH